MESIKELYRIGHGPSSSHTMGPRFAAERFKQINKDALSYKVSLYGSLAATGKGHLTDVAIIEAFNPKKVQIAWYPHQPLPFHPNGMKFEAIDRDGNSTNEWTAYSVGGGRIVDNSTSSNESTTIYKHHTTKEIMRYTERYNLTYWEYVEKYEGAEIWDYLLLVWTMMKKSIEEGLDADGILPGELKLRRKAAAYKIKANGYRNTLKFRCLIMAYAMAVSEQNAAGAIVVTAPTCGSSGVLPSILYHLYKNHKMSEKQILRALATAGLFGNIIKQNASISGAEVGCQGEVGSACSMAAAAACQLMGGSSRQIEYAAEMGLEHHLGMTCDPVCGLVQIPCIERNAFGALRAFDANLKSLMTDGRHMISFDKVVDVMNTTGHDLPNLYKETSLGGLALTKENKQKNQK